MKIIKHGTPQVTTRIFVCEDCHCIFEAGISEYIKIPVDYNGDVKCVAVCPECRGRSEDHTNKHYYEEGEK